MSSSKSTEYSRRGASDATGDNVNVPLGVGTSKSSLFDQEAPVAILPIPILSSSPRVD